MNRLITVAITAHAALVLTGCPAPPLDPLDPGAERSAPAWDIRWTEDIAVCWEDAGRELRPVQDAVEAAVRPAIEATTGLRLVGWETCTADAAGVRIAHHSGPPMVQALGRDLAGVPAGVKLDLMPTWDETCGGLEACAAVHARHAFAHVMGLDRPAPAEGSCAGMDHAPTGLMVEGPSVMQACGDAAAPDRFTTADRLALGRLYGTVDQRWGEALVACDFDGDGVEDLAVGRPGHMLPVADGFARNAGRVDLLLGDHRRVALLHPRPAADDRFGAVLAAADLDGDGDCDLAVGHPAHAQDSGGVVVFLGAEGGEIGAPRFIGAGQMADNDAEANDRFGAALAAGDLDGDGRAELIVGAPGEDLLGRLDIGAVAILPGTDAGPDAAGALLLDGVRVETLEAEERFGGALTTGDIDGDGHLDLIIGSPGSGASARVAHLLGGPDYAIQPLVQTELGAVDGRGMALGAGLLDGSGRDRVAIGLPAVLDAAIPAGRLFVAALEPDDRRFVTTSIGWIPSTRATEPTRYGAAVLVFDGVVLVGAPGEARVYVERFEDGDIHPETILPGPAGSGFGTALARGRDGGVAIGAPLRSVEGTGGRVHCPDAPEAERVLNPF